MRWAESVKPKDFKDFRVTDLAAARNEATTLFKKGMCCEQVARAVGMSASWARLLRNELGFRSSFFDYEGNKDVIVHDYVEGKLEISAIAHKYGFPMDRVGHTLWKYKVPLRWKINSSRNERAFDAVLKAHYKSVVDHPRISTDRRLSFDWRVGNIWIEWAGSIHFPAFRI